MTTTAVTDGKAVHVIPVYDVVAHRHEANCPCKPDKAEGSRGAVYTHHLVARR